MQLRNEPGPSDQFCTKLRVRHSDNFTPVTIDIHTANKRRDLEIPRVSLVPAWSVPHQTARMALGQFHTLPFYSSGGGSLAPQAITPNLFIRLTGALLSGLLVDNIVRSGHVYTGLHPWVLSIRIMTIPIKMEGSQASANFIYHWTWPVTEFQKSTDIEQAMSYVKPLYQTVHTSGNNIHRWKTKI